MFYFCVNTNLMVVLNLKQILQNVSEKTKLLLIMLLVKPRVEWHVYQFNIAFDSEKQDH